METLVLMETMSSLNRVSLGRGKRWIFIIAAAGIAIVSVMGSIVFPILVIRYLKNDGQAAGASTAITQIEVEREFQTIARLPLAVTVQHSATHKALQGVVSTSYKTEHSYQEIKAFYDKELPSLGWRFLREANVTYGGEDYGGQELFYCKGDSTAHVQYAGRQEKQFGWTYSFALTWGLSNGCK
jgi:hypothetical protein